MMNISVIFGQMLISITSFTSNGNSVNDNADLSFQDTLVYRNGLGCKLLIYNKKDNIFNYKLSNKCQAGVCGGLDDMEGEATLESPNSNLSEDPRYSEPAMVNFNFLEDGNVLMVEPDPSYIGYECAGTFETIFKLAK